MYHCALRNGEENDARRRGKRRKRECAEESLIRATENERNVTARPLWEARRREASAAPKEKRDKGSARDEEEDPDWKDDNGANGARNKSARETAKADHVDARARRTVPGQEQFK